MNKTIKLVKRVPSLYTDIMTIVIEFENDIGLIKKYNGHDNLIESKKVKSEEALVWVTHPNFKIE